MTETKKRQPVPHDDDPQARKLRTMLLKLQREVAAGEITHTQASQALGRYADALTEPPTKPPHRQRRR